MKLLFKQRIFTWFDSYDIYGENGDVVYVVKGQLAWGHCFKIYDNSGCEVGCIKEVVLSWLPKFEIYINGQYVGCISKKISFLKPMFDIDYNRWHIDGDFFGLDYRILDSVGNNIAKINKEVFNWTDTYVIDVPNPKDAIDALMLVIAIDAEKCSRN